RAQHVLAKIGALQADQARAARIAQPGNIRTRAWEAILPRHQAVLLRALSADEQKRLVLDHRAARAKSKLLPAVIRGARRKPRCAKHLVTKIAKQIAVPFSSARNITGELRRNPHRASRIQ